MASRIQQPDLTTLSPVPGLRLGWHHLVGERRVLEIAPISTVEYARLLELLVSADTDLLTDGHNRYTVGGLETLPHLFLYLPGGIRQSH